MKRILVSATAALAVGAAVPAIATAHHATVVCDQTTGQYVVTPDYLQFNPTWTISDSVVTVNWTDGFKRVVPLPGACEAPTPTPAPKPSVPEIVPVPVVPPAPPTCAELLARYPKAGPVRVRSWGCVVTPKPHHPKRAKRTVITRYYPCVINGRRAKTVITVTLPSGKVGHVTKYGKHCKIPAVTG